MKKTNNSKPVDQDVKTNSDQTMKTDGVEGTPIQEQVATEVVDQQVSEPVSTESQATDSAVSEPKVD